MNRLAFADLLRQAIFGVWDAFLHKRPADHPYAFALIGGQCGNHLGYAIATVEGLKRLAADYESQGYRYLGGKRERFDNREQLSIWLRWANPDDGWLYGSFPKDSQVQTSLAKIVKAGELGEDAEKMEEVCTDVLASLQIERKWKPWSGRIVVGFTYGEDPRDFLRTATRATPYPLVRKLWAEYWYGNEMSDRITAPE